MLLLLQIIADICVKLFALALLEYILIAHQIEDNSV